MFIKIFLSFILYSTINPAFALEESFHSLQTRAEAEQPFWLIEPKNPVANVILFAGGSGKIKISKKGINKTGNFLVRSRKRFAKAGFTVAIIDVPTDQEDLLYFRNSKDHGKDIQTIIQFLNKRNQKPVWLIGTSRGTISAAAVASRLSDQALKGLVLTSSVFTESNDGKESLEEVKVESITIPTLFVHHEEDECYVTAYDDLKSTMKKFTNAKKLAVKTFTGGNNENINPCKGNSYHGYFGIEDTVVTSISQWIKENNQ